MFMFTVRRNGSERKSNYYYTGWLAGGMMFTEVENFPAVLLSNNKFPPNRTLAQAHTLRDRGKDSRSIQADSIQIIIINKILLVGSVALSLGGEGEVSTQIRTNK